MHKNLLDLNCEVGICIRKQTINSQLLTLYVTVTLLGFYCHVNTILIVILAQCAETTAFCARLI